MVMLGALASLPKKVVRYAPFKTEVVCLFTTELACHCLAMDSSMKKTRFEAFQDEDEGGKKKENGSKIYIYVLIFLIAFSVAAVITIGVVVGVITSTERPTTAAPTSDGLTVDTVTQEELSGEYYGSNGAGIRFQIVINTTYYTLIVTSIGTGEDVINVMHPQSSNMTMTSINKTGFMIMDSESRLNDYVVPSNATGVMEAMMRSDDPKMTEDLFRELDSINVNVTLHFALHDFASSQEALLIIEAAEALGNRNTANSSYPPVMQFYLLAMQIGKIRRYILEEGYSTTMPPMQRKRSISTRQLVRCSNGGGTCSASRCPYSRPGNDCHGMCGYGCSCWSWLCGDCCVHQYCETHDDCCAREGFFSFACFRAGYDYFFSSCSRNYRC